MRTLQRITVILFALVTLAFIGTKVYVSRTVDRTAPVIKCESELIEVSVTATDSELLAGVTAQDDRDGDISGSIMIKGISQLISADTARVSYIVFDSSNNMATADRLVRYTDYEKPIFVLRMPLVFKTGSQVTLLTHLYASDVLDGDISENIRVTKQNVNSNIPGVYNITFQVTNSMGDTESIPAKVVIRDDLPSPLPVRLSRYVTYLEVGEEFDPAFYIIAPADKSQVEIVSDLDVETPGAYEVSYTYADVTVYMTVVVR